VREARRHWRALLAAALAVIVGLGIGVALSWHFSSKVVVPGHSDLTDLAEDVTVEAIHPTSTSEDLAQELPRWVSFHPPPEADHMEAWNVAPELYDRRLGAFLRRIGAAAEIRSRAAASSSPRSPRG
jgi:hypothetical protein